MGETASRPVRHVPVNPSCHEVKYVRGGVSVLVKRHGPKAPNANDPVFAPIELNISNTQMADIYVILDAAFDEGLTAQAQKNEEYPNDSEDEEGNPACRLDLLKQRLESELVSLNQTLPTGIQARLVCITVQSYSVKFIRTYERQTRGASAKVAVSWRPNATPTLVAIDHTTLVAEIASWVHDRLNSVDSKSSRSDFALYSGDALCLPTSTVMSVVRRSPPLEHLSRGGYSSGDSKAASPTIGVLTVRPGPVSVSVTEKTTSLLVPISTLDTKDEKVQPSLLDCSFPVDKSAVDEKVPSLVLSVSLPGADGASKPAPLIYYYVITGTIYMQIKETKKVAADRPFRVVAECLTTEHVYSARFHTLLENQFRTTVPDTDTGTFAFVRMTYVSDHGTIDPRPTASASSK